MEAQDRELVVVAEGEPETRSIPGVEIRKNAKGEARGIAGVAAVYDQGTVIAGQFEERIAPGAFDDALGADDVVALFNHNTAYVLGRTTSGTLRLESRSDGLYYEVPEMPKSRADVLEAIERRDVAGNSFAFTIESDEDEEWTDRSDEGKLPLRVIKRVGKLFDVGPVTHPAYKQTSVSARAIEKRNAVVPERLRQVAVCEECEELRRRVEHLEREVRLAKAEAA